MSPLPPHSRAGLLVASLCLGACAAPDSTALPDPVAPVLDGSFDEWVSPALVIDDPIDASGSPIELSTVEALDSPGWLYLLIDFGTDVNAQAMPGTVHLLFDADADPATGLSAFGSDGVDFALDLSRMDRPQMGGHGAGFALRAVRPDGLGAYRSAYELDVVGLPTWASPTIEMRIARGGAEDGFGRLGSTIRMRAVFESEGRILDETPWGTYTFATEAGSEPIPTTTASLQRPAGATRIAQWNVSEGSFRTPELHARVLAALEPDVVLLDEVFEEADAAFLEAFFGDTELGALGTWSFAIALGGGRQKTVVAARDRALRPEETMRRVAYAEGAVDALRSETPEPFHRLLDFEKERDLSATGVWVELDGTEVLFVPLDLESGGFFGGPDDALRDLQTVTIREHVLRVLAGLPERAPMVIGGDFNTVGSGVPLQAMARGLDVDGGDLVRSVTPRLGDRTHTTWRDVRRGPFGPGMLDFTLYAGAAFEQVGGFVFATEDLDDATLEALGLQRDDSTRTSDHLVVVTDLRLR